MQTNYGTTIEIVRYTYSPVNLVGQDNTKSVYSKVSSLQQSTISMLYSPFNLVERNSSKSVYSTVSSLVQSTISALLS